jgi:hypothetical protein
MNVFFHCFQINNWYYHIDIAGESLNKSVRRHKMILYERMHVSLSHIYSGSLTEVGASIIESQTHDETWHDTSCFYGSFQCGNAFLSRSSWVVRCFHIFLTQLHHFRLWVVKAFGVKDLPVWLWLSMHGCKLGRNDQAANTVVSSRYDMYLFRAQSTDLEVL